MIKGVLIAAAIGLVIVIVAILIDFYSAPEYDIEDCRQSISEYRTYVVNHWIQLLLFWFQMKEDDVSINAVSPGPNQNLIYFNVGNTEIKAYFLWDDYKMAVEITHYSESSGYSRRERAFRLSGGLDNEKLYNFVKPAIDTFLDMEEVTEADVIAIVAQLKDMPPAFKTSEEADQYLFNKMVELILVMRQKRTRNNRKLLKTYAGLMYHLWQTKKEEFIKFLEEENEDFEG